MIVKDDIKLINDIKEKIPEINGVDIRTIPPLTLAYVGDSVMDMFVRTYFATTTHETVQNLNSRAIKVVNASSQAKLLMSLQEILTDEEKDVARRGRNAKSATKPKHADVNDYRLATGLEALLGYLFINGNTERLCEIFAYMKNEMINGVQSDIKGL